MDNLSLGYNQLRKNYGYYIDKAPQNILEELKVQIDELQNNFDIGEKYNHMLVGEIEHEYSIKPQSQTKQYIKYLTQQFENNSQYMVSNYTPLPTLTFDDLWVNFQKKYEYNPIHNHNGIYSFVIWYQIPYTFENEKKYHYKPAEQDCNHGKFAFVSSDKLNTLSKYTLNIDQNKEGYVAIFPSNLNHIVYPFYSSDEYRITIAGNILGVE